MLGRFSLTGSFSRRLNPGFSMGSTEFGFRFCERAFSNVCIIWVPHSSDAAIQSHDSGSLTRKRSTRFSWRCSTPLIWVGPPASARNFRIQTRLPDMRRITRGVFVEDNRRLLRLYNRFCLQGTDQSPPRSALLTANWRGCEGGPCGRGCRPIRFSDRKIAARRSIASVTTGCLPTPTAPAISHWPVISSAYPIQARQAKAMAPKMVPNTKSGTLVLAAAGA